MKKRLEGSVRAQPHRFQPQAHDHVLREAERKRDAFARICYIQANPVCAHLIDESEVWPFASAVVPNNPRFHPLTGVFWPKYWKSFQAARQPDAGERKLPLRSSQLRHFDSH